MTADSVGLFLALIAIASVVVLASRGLGIPDEVGLLLVGLGAALFLPPQTLVTPDLVLLVLLPGLVFEAAYRLDFDEFRASLWSVGLLAIPGVLITAAIVAFVLSAAIGMDAKLAFLVGAMVSPTDPAAMVAAFARLRTPSGLATLIQSESLLNDGTGIVLFTVALGFVSGTATVEGAVLAIGYAIVGSVVIGLALGFAASRLVATIDDSLVEITITVALAYGAYLLADQVHLSGIIATVVAGITLGNYGKRIGMSERTREAASLFWGVVAFVLTALVFLLVGVAIRLDALLEARSAVLWAALAILAARALAVYGMLGLMGAALRGAGLARMPLGWLHVTFWAGLRGAVAVALALSLPADIPQRQLLQEIVFGVVLVTILVQGTTVPFVVGRALGTATAE